MLQRTNQQTNSSFDDIDPASKIPHHIQEVWKGNRVKSKYVTDS